MSVRCSKLASFILLLSGCLVSTTELLDSLINRSPTRYMRRVYQTAKDEAVAMTCSFKNTKESLGYFSSGEDTHFTGRPIIWYRVDGHGGRELVAIGDAVENKMAAFHNYKVLTPDTSTSILYIPQVAANHIGFYKCMLADGELIHQMFFLNVTQSKLIIRHPFPSIQTVMLGSSVQLSCNVSYTYPRPLIYWTRGRAGIRESLHPVAWGPFLKIRNMNKKLTGLYTCHADDFLTPPVSTSFQLRLDESKPKSGPKFIIAQYNHNPAGFAAYLPRYGHLYVLTCRSSGNPRVYFYWFKNGKNVKEMWDPNLSIHTTVTTNGHVLTELQIQRFKIEDRGVYRCKAFNNYGSKFFTFQLNKIRDVPKVVQDKLNQLTNTMQSRPTPSAPADDEDYKPSIQKSQIAGSGSGHVPKSRTNVFEASGYRRIESSGVTSLSSKKKANATISIVSNFTSKP